MILISGFANSKFRTLFHLGGDWSGGRKEFVLHARQRFLEEQMRRAELAHNRGGVRTLHLITNRIAPRALPRPQIDAQGV